MSTSLDLRKTPDLFLSRHSLAVSALFIALLLATVFVYQPALSGPFMLDDFDNLAPLEIGVVDAESLKNYLDNGKAGPLGRPIAKLSFLLDDNAWPSAPENFKRNNLFIHLLIGVFVFVACRFLARATMEPSASDWFALLVAAIFLTHPLQVSTVMYVIQRMTQLSSLFVMLGVVLHLYWRSRYILFDIKALVLMSLSLIICTIMAVLSKESGALLPVFILIIEATLLQANKQSILFTWWRRVFLLLPTITILIYMAYWPNWTGSYGGRDFTMGERLLTQPVVLMDYLGSITSMRVGGLGLFHDDYTIYSSFSDPTVFASLLFLIGSIGFAVKYRRKFPMLSFGILWFFAGHLIESTTVSLELYFEHRNYLPIIGPVIAIFTILNKGLLKISADVAKFAPVFSAMILGISSMSTWGYASEWSSLERIIPIWSAEHPNSPRAQRTYAQLLASKGLPEAGLDVLDDAYKRFPYDMSIPVMSIDISCVFNRPIRYEFSQLASVASTHRVTDGLRPVLQSLFARIDKTRCKENTADLHFFVRSLPELQKGERLRSAIASFFVLDGNLYLREGDAKNALQSFEIVDHLKPSADSARRIAGLFLMSKNYEQARDMLNLARQRERSSNWGISSEREAKYREKMELIDRLENKTKT